MGKLVADHRRRELAQIHIAKKDLGMEDDAYRGVIKAISNGATDSAGGLDFAGRKKLLDHLKSCGFKVKPKDAKRLFPDTPAWNKIWSLWQTLADQGKVQDRRAGALLAFCKHQTKVDQVAWMDAGHVFAVTEALKSWVNRK
jgi:phage gp16-like protein